MVEDEQGGGRVLSSEEQRVWDEVQRFWAVDAEEPPRLASAASSTRRVWHDEEDLPLAVAAGVWLTIALVLFGAVLAGLAVAAVTAAGWALWRNRARLVRVVGARVAHRETEVSCHASRSSGSLPTGQPVDGGEDCRGT
jgi:hypothetical protein